MFGMDSTKAKSQEHVEPDMNSNSRAVDSHKNNRLRKTLSVLFLRVRSLAPGVMYFSSAYLIFL